MPKYKFGQSKFSDSGTVEAYYSLKLNSGGNKIWLFFLKWQITTAIASSIYQDKIFFVQDNIEIVQEKNLDQH